MTVVCVLTFQKQKQDGCVNSQLFSRIRVRITTTVLKHFGYWQIICRPTTSTN